MLAIAAAADKAPVKIIFDTDMIGDYDDVGAMAAPPAAVPPVKMKEIYETVKTPYKLGMVLTPEKG